MKKLFISNETRERELKIFDANAEMQTIYEHLFYTSYSMQSWLGSIIENK